MCLEHLQHLYFRLTSTMKWYQHCGLRTRDFETGKPSKSVALVPLTTMTKNTPHLKKQKTKNGSVGWEEALGGWGTPAEMSSGVFHHQYHTHQKHTTCVVWLSCQQANDVIRKSPACTTSFSRLYTQCLLRHHVEEPTLT